MLPLNEYSAIIYLLSDTKNCTKLFRNRSFIEVDPLQSCKGVENFDRLNGHRATLHAISDSVNNYTVE